MSFHWNNHCIGARVPRIGTRTFVLSRNSQWSGTKDAVFIAANWGVAYPIYCFAGGRPEIVYELYFNYRGPKHRRRIQSASGKRELYLVGRVRQRPGVMLAKRKRIEDDLERLPEWEEIAVPEPVSKLKGIWVRRFLYRPEKKSENSKHEIRSKF